MSFDFRLLTLNVAHGRGTSFHQALTSARQVRRNLDEVAELILASGADLVTLQELDGASSWSGGFDHLEYLAERTGLDHSHHGVHVHRPRLPQLSYGTGLLSRFPLQRAFSFAFDQNPLDTKGFAFAQVKIPGGCELGLVSVHLDFKRRRERRAQLAVLSRFLSGILGAAPERTLVAGDFNCSVEGPVLGAFAEEHELEALQDRSPTFPARRPRRRLDDVLVGGGFQVERGEVLDGFTVSDHLPVLAHLAE